MKTILLFAMALISVSTSMGVAQVIRRDAKAAHAVYGHQCLRRHGATLDGNGPDSKDLVIPPSHFQSQKSRSKTDWELLVAISNGVLFSPMHGFRGKLTDQQLLDVLSYIRSVAQPDLTS